MRMRRRILAPVGLAILGAVIAVLIGYPFVHHVATERDRLTRQVADLESGFNNEQARAAALQEKLDAHNQEIAAANLRAQRDDLWRAAQEQAAKQTAAHLSRLNDELEAAQGSGRQAQQANAKLQQRLSELQAQSAERQRQLIQAHDRQQKLEAQLAGRQQSAAHLGQQLAEARQTGSRLQQRLDEQQAQLAANKKQLAADQETGQQRTARIADLTDALQRARDQQQALQTKIQSVGAARQAAEARVADLEQKLASTPQSRTATSAAALAPATGGNESLQRRLAELQAQLNRYTAQQPMAEHSAARDSDDLAAARQRAAQLTEAYKTQLENATKLKHVNADTLNQLAAARNALEKAQAEIARIEGARGIYTVQGGDSLSLIAAFFYHNGNRWPQIFKANAFLVSNPDLIFPGMVLIVPE